MTTDVSYTYVPQLTAKFRVVGRSESAAFLMWVLENYFRLDETAAQYAVCDSSGDRGIDGIFVDENSEAIYVFQCKLQTTVPSREIGDRDLRSFEGALNHFRSENSVNELISIGSTELSGLLRSEKIAQLVKDNYSVHGIFVTNSIADSNAKTFVHATGRIELYDKPYLEQKYIPLSSTDPIAGTVEFASPSGVFEYSAATARAIIASISAPQLLKMDGIENQTLFSWNVRHSLGNTAINKDIAGSIKVIDKHDTFLLYHNGITILCKKLEIEKNRIKLSDYTVVNGCQSLNALYNNRTFITDKLELLVRIIEVDPDSELARDITNNTNNQNAIKARDFRSNSPIQRRLKAEFERYYPTITYTIKRGEVIAGQEIDNQTAAQTLVAFDLEEPWDCHQVYRLFEDLHDRAFRGPEVTAHRILFLHDILDVVRSKLDDIEDKLMANYSLTKFFLMYLIRKALETDDLGIDLCRNPQSFMQQSDGRARIRTAVETILSDLIIDLNGEVKELADSPSGFDYKRALRNSTEVKSLEKTITAAYSKYVARGRVPSFTQQWNSVT